MAPNPSSLECVSKVLLLCLVDLTVIKGLDLMGYFFLCDVLSCSLFAFHVTRKFFHK